MVPLVDADVRAWCSDLGVPGLYDVHVHFLPAPVMARVWEHFDSAWPLIGRQWPITYRGSDTERVAQLRALGVRRFSALPYAHKPDIAEYLNDWAARCAANVPEALLSATFYPEPSTSTYVSERLAQGTEVFKAHVQVGDFDPRDPQLDTVWGQLAEAGTPVVVIAHMGAPEYVDFLTLAETYSRVHLDTTMAFTEFFENMALYAVHLLPRLAALEDRVLLGSDFPSIPHPYASQLEGLERLGLGDAWLRKVCWENAAAVFGKALSC